MTMSNTKAKIKRARYVGIVLKQSVIKIKLAGIVGTDLQDSRGCLLGDLRHTLQIHN
jgi:hypothetical protein